MTDSHEPEPSRILLDLQGTERTLLFPRIYIILLENEMFYPIRAGDQTQGPENAR